MRKLTGAVFQSLDGVMQAPGGPDEDPTSDFRFGGWSFHFWDETLEKPFGKVIDADYDLLLGKRTYDIFSAFWPNNRDNPIGERFQRINKYVLTHSNEPLTWEHSHRLSGDTAEGRDLLIQGSSTLYPPLLAAGLIDRLVVMVFPVVLGEGKGIFDGSKASGSLRLKEHAISDKGVAFLSYEPAGEVPTGSFATKPPSEDELELRQKIEEGSW
jgi:dihydrofolate reductase